MVFAADIFGVPKLLSVDAVAELLGMSPRWVYQQAQSGRLGHVRLARRAIRFRQEDVDAFVASCVVEPTARPAAPVTPLRATRAAPPARPATASGTDWQVPAR
jgi:excisionase family DNA binding protein